MITVATVSRKGGSGKTTMAVHLAVCAERQGVPTVILDLDPQGSACAWRKRRQEDTPEVVAADDPSQLEGLLRKAQAGGAGLVIVDTAPHSDRAAALTAQLADLVLVPCRPSAFDVDAISSTLTITRLADARVAVVLNAVPTRGAYADEVRAGLSMQATVAPVTLYQRAAYFNAVNDGRSVEEYEPKGKAAEEIRLLYQWVMGQSSDHLIKL
jgi:chromosome partitioning protein